MNDSPAGSLATALPTGALRSPANAVPEGKLYHVTLTPTPGNRDPVRSLRALLKTALRHYQLRCVDCRETAKG